MPSNQWLQLNMLIYVVADVVTLKILHEGLFAVVVLILCGFVSILFCYFRSIGTSQQIYFGVGINRITYLGGGQYFGV